MGYFVDEDEDRAARVKRFRYPGGASALHPGKRTEPCPTCDRANQLTKKDVAEGYQCDRCADGLEKGTGR